MFFGCYLAGSIPLALTLSEGLLRRVTTFGAGLLIGTALLVIIPEGVEALYSEGLEHQHTHNAPHALPTVHSEEAVALINAPNIVADHDHVAVVDVTTTTVVASTERMGEQKLQTLMGLSLLLGFVFMLFVDQVGGGHSHAPSSGIDLEVGSAGRHRRHSLTATIGLVVHAAGKCILSNRVDSCTELLVVF
jgi:zinc transporter 9